jgi:hypothetical protein
LTTHGKFSGVDLVAQNLANNKKEVPHILEIAIAYNKAQIAESILCVPPVFLGYKKIYAPESQN